MPREKFLLIAICFAYLLGSLAFASTNLDIDEFSFIREPYELLGGDYTVGYLRNGEYKNALSCFARSYFLYWQYRPLNAPIISPKHKTMFSREEDRFNYKKPSAQSDHDINHYEQRLVVPEPDRFYTHRAGKPLLPAILSIPQLALVRSVTSGPRGLIELQFNNNYHPLFILVRLAQIAAGLVSCLLLYKIVSAEADSKLALYAAALFALFPSNIQYFPNLHHDSIMVPFLIGASYLFVKRRHVMGGILFGLALASKNTAIFFALALVVYSSSEFLYLLRSTDSPSAYKYVREQLKGLSTFAIVSLVVLTPFANPISYFQEIATPISHREFDPRGEDVSQFTLTKSFTQQEKSDSMSFVRPEVGFLKRLLRFNTSFFFISIFIFMMFEKKKNPLSMFSFIFLLLVLPYGLLFGYHLGYRHLMFVPFFVILCVHCLGKKSLLTLLLILVVLDFAFCLDPITTDKLHTLRNTTVNTHVFEN